MIISTSWHGIVLSCFPSGRCHRCPRLRWTILPPTTSRWHWGLAWPDRRIPQHLCTAFECVPRQPHDLSLLTRLFAVWNAPHHSGRDATFRRQQQVLVRLVHSSYPDRFDSCTVQPARTLSPSAIFAKTTSPNGPRNDPQRQPRVLSYGFCFVSDQLGSAPPSGLSAATSMDKVACQE